MLSILQRYIGRELFKTFALTAFGLTLTFSLCGGLLNMLQAEALSAMQIVRVLAFILPVATTLTLPVAAMFACAIVYGRLAMDNEIDACKASGVNIHRLLLPALLLSVFTGLFTFAFSNYVIPRFIRGLDEMVQRDIHKILMQALSSKGYIRKGPYVLYAGNASQISADIEGKDIIIHQAAFLEIVNESLVRCGTADQVQVSFSPSGASGRPVVEAAMFDLRLLDIEHTRFDQIAEQSFSPMEVSTGSLVLRPKWLNLQELLQYRRRPTDLPSMREKMDNIRYTIAETMYYRDLYDALVGPDKKAVIQDARRRYEVRAARVERAEEDFKLALHDVALTETWGQQRRDHSAERMSLSVEKGFVTGPDTVHAVLEKTKFVDAGQPDKTFQSRRNDLEPISLPPTYREAAARLSDVDLLGPDWFASDELPDLQLGERVQNARMRLRLDVAKTYLEIMAIIHSRLAFSASVLVMLVLAAALGIIHRGGQLLTAFAVSFVPGLFVVVMNIMGRQLAENTGTHLIGLSLMWSAIAVVALADTVVLTRYLRR